MYPLWVSNWLPILKNQKRVTSVGTNWYILVLKINVLDLFCSAWVCSFVIKMGANLKQSPCRQEHRSG
jgi:hypothetical protein